MAGLHKWNQRVTWKCDIIFVKGYVYEKSHLLNEIELKIIPLLEQNKFFRKETDIEQ